MPSKFLVRYCEKENDFRLMCDLTVRSWSLSGPRQTMHVGDLYWRFLRDVEGYRTNLFPMWFDRQGHLLAYAQFDPPSVCDMLVHPDHRGGALEDQMLEWAEERSEQELSALGKSGGVTAPCLDNELGRRKILQQRGFHEKGQQFIHFFRSLDQPTIKKVIASGYQVRSMRDQNEFLQTVETSRELHGRNRLGPARYKRMLGSGGFTPEQDVVALDSEGRIVAACIWWLDEFNKVGKLEPLGCHPDHRRKGLATAVIAESLLRLRSRGAESVVVCTNSKSTAAIRCYESCGFTRVVTDCSFFKPVIHESE